MTPQAFAEDLKRKLNDLKTNNRPLKLAAAASHDEMSKRIFTQGKDTNENSIGSYQTASGTYGKKEKGDMWRNPNNPGNRNKSGFTPLTGKGGYTGFKTSDNERKTKYFRGWEGFRQAQGLQTNVVNLNYTGEMFSDFNRPVRFVNPQEYVSSFNKSESVKKAEGNSAHFKTTIFKLSTEEKRTFFRVAEKTFKLIFQP